MWGYRHVSVVHGYALSTENEVENVYTLDKDTGRHSMIFHMHTCSGLILHTHTGIFRI